MIEMYTGTIGSGKSYHALEDVIDWLRKGKYVIANFPLKFADNHITNGMADRYLFIDDKLLMGKNGMRMLYKISHDYNFYGKESECLVVIDEAGEYFPQNEATNQIQKDWKLFMTQSRKLGYDFILITQDEQAINRTIRKCVEYEVIHRVANNVFPFKYLPFTVFMRVRYWNKRPKQRLGSDSTVFVKRLSDMYDTHRLFADIDTQLSFMPMSNNLDLHFGNLIAPERRAAAHEKRKNSFLRFFKKEKY